MCLTCVHTPLKCRSFHQGSKRDLLSTPRKGGDSVRMSPTPEHSSPHHHKRVYSNDDTELPFYDEDRKQSTTSSFFFKPIEALKLMWRTRWFYYSREQHLNSVQNNNNSVHSYNPLELVKTGWSKDFDPSRDDPPSPQSRSRINILYPSEILQSAEDILESIAKDQRKQDIPNFVSTDIEATLNGKGGGGGSTKITRKSGELEGFGG